MPLLAARNLARVFGRRRVVDGLSVELEKGEIVGLLGPNGAGKTTTFEMIIGLSAPDGGEIVFRDTDVTRLPVYRRARLGMGYLPQEKSVFRRLSVEDNILAVLEWNGELRRPERLDRRDRLLREFELDHLRAQKADTLSGGEARRLEIARLLAREPALILLDEPFSGVDPIIVQDLQEILGRLRDRGIAILLTDHNVRETLHITDRSYIISEGRILRQGTADELVRDEQVRRTYLGERFTI